MKVSAVMGVAAVAAVLGGLTSCAAPSDSERAAQYVQHELRGEFQEATDMRWDGVREYVENEAKFLRMNGCSAFEARDSAQADRGVTEIHGVMRCASGGDKNETIGMKDGKVVNMTEKGAGQ